MQSVSFRINYYIIKLCLGYFLCVYVHLHVVDWTPPSFQLHGLSLGYSLLIYGPHNPVVVYWWIQQSFSVKHDDHTCIVCIHHACSVDIKKRSNGNSG